MSFFAVHPSSDAAAVRLALLRVTASDWQLPLLA